jgi:hypothetical protein
MASVAESGMIKMSARFLLVFTLLYTINSFQPSSLRNRNPLLQMGPINSIKNLIRAPAIQEGKTFDYIIIGGGTAGCVLANRLSENESKSVLVLEAGSKDFKHKYIQIPAGVLQLFKSKFDWDFASSPEPNVNERSIYLCRGKVLGKSTKFLIVHL